MVETGSFTGHNQAANGYNNPSDPNTCTSKVEQLSEKEIPQQDLAELLGVTPDVNPSEGPETDSAQQKLRDVRLIQASVSQHLPKPPSDLDQNLQQHLVNVQDTVRSELMRLSPRLEKMGLTGSLIDCYHHQTLDHICDLFKKVQSSQKMFELMNWVLHPYLRYVRHLCILHAFLSLFSILAVHVHIHTNQQREIGVTDLTELFCFNK